MQKQFSYLELTEEQRLQADAIPHTLGRGLDDAIFSVYDNGQVSAVCSIIRDQVYTDTWGYFCYEHRQAFARSENPCCAGNDIYPVRTEKQAQVLLGLKTLREQFNAME